MAHLEESLDNEEISPIDFMRKAKYSIQSVINGFPEDDDFSENEDDIENQENANENRRNICPVCFYRTKNAAITPCGHTLCLDCGNRIATQPTMNHCPECRGPIGSIMQLFGLN